MPFELLYAIGDTASAAIVVATLAFAFASTHRGRIEVAAFFAAWFALVVFLGATSALSPARGAGVPGLGGVVVVPLAAMCLAFFTMPSIRMAAMAMPLPILVAVNMLRVLGISFVVFYAAGRLPAPFAPSAGWGDIFIGIAALPVAWAAARFGARARNLIFAWNALGIVDLVAAIGFGATSSPGPIQIFVGPPDSSLMTTLPWLLIPGFLVPCYLFIHVAIFYRLSRRGVSTDASSNPTARFSGEWVPTSAAGARAGNVFQAVYRAFAHMSA
jgi:hypothetical protein